MVQKIYYQSLAWVLVLNMSTRVALSGAHPFAVCFLKKSFSTLMQNRSNCLCSLTPFIAIIFYFQFTPFLDLWWSIYVCILIFSILSSGFFIFFTVYCNFTEEWKGQNKGAACLQAGAVNSSLFLLISFLEILLASYGSHRSWVAGTYLIKCTAMWDRQTDIQVFRFLNCLLLSQIARLTHLSHWVWAASLAAVNTALPLVSPVRDVLLKIQLCWFTNLNFLIVLIMATFASLIL